MASLFKRPRSPYWQAAYYDSEGKRYYRSTKKRRKVEAQVAAARFEQAARLTTSEDDERARRILGTLEEAGYRGYFTVERDRSRNPVAEIANAVQYLQQM